MVYYNEHDPKLAPWLYELMAAGEIALGIVDTRSIEDVTANDLRHFSQHHFFAGIGGWSAALRLAGWPDDRPVWTGSCPCQPFSAAGKGGGFDDERHLWPAWHWLIAQLRPSVVFGEQVASKDGLNWLDLVQTDLEAAGYAFGAVDLCAAGLGAPHIRQRLWFVADANSLGRTGLGGGGQNGTPERGEAGRTVADADLRRALGHDEGRLAGQSGGRGSPWSTVDWVACRDGKSRPIEPGFQSVVDGLPGCVGLVRPEAVAALEAEVTRHAAAANTDPRDALHDVWREALSQALRQRPFGRPDGFPQARILLAFLRQLARQGWPLAQSLPRSGEETREACLRVLRGEYAPSRSPRRRGLDEQQTGQSADVVRVLSSVLARHASTTWPDADATYAPADFPLSFGTPGRVTKLRAYGNAIVPQVAAAFIESYLEL